MAMTELFSFYMDESGFTGEQLMSRDQPVFVHVSMVLSGQQCQELYREFFAGVQAPELKHSVIGRRPNGRDRVVRFVEAVNAHHKEGFTSWFVHKEFALMTYLVDTWVEWAAHNDGYDLYQDGANLGLANMAYYCLQAFQSEAYLRSHMMRFETMMMKRTPESYRGFWGPMYTDLDRLDKNTRDVLVFFVGSEAKLGYTHLLGLPKRTIDPAMPGAVFTCGHWRKTTRAPLRLVHDQSSSLTKDKYLWELVTSPDIDEMTLGMPDRELIYPLNVQETVFGDSKEFLQLQFCDLIAGASAAWARRFTGPSYDQAYFEALDNAGIENLKIGSIWPQMEVTPEGLGMKGWSGAHVEAITEQLQRIKR